MRRKPQAGLGITALIVLTLLLPSRGAAQTTASPWTAATATATPTDTSGKTKQTIEINSLQFGASNPSSLTPGQAGQGGKKGKVSTSDITVGGGTPVTPVYKAPGIIVPPSGGTPNDSAHHPPKH